VPGIFRTRFRLGSFTENESRARDGDDFVLNGPKVWGTLGQFADWIFCLVRRRRDHNAAFRADRHENAGHHGASDTCSTAFGVNEIWFDNVRVPVMTNRIGETGWTYAKFLLGHERTSIAGIGA
jgi:hypothetical protein